MKLPGIERAEIDSTKVSEYLLSAEHPVGRFKAAFFRSLGYSPSDWEALLADLLHFATVNDAVPGKASPYGQKYEVTGMLLGPVGRQAKLVTVWIILTGEDVPHLVTAYPGADA